MYDKVSLDGIERKMEEAIDDFNVIAAAVKGTSLPDINVRVNMMQLFTDSALSIGASIVAQALDLSLPSRETVVMSPDENVHSMALRFDNLSRSFLRTANGWNTFAVPTGSDLQAKAIAEYMNGGNGPLGLIEIEKKLIWLYNAKHNPHVPTPMEVGEPTWVKRLEKKLDYIIVKIDAK